MQICPCTLRVRTMACFCQWAWGLVLVVMLPGARRTREGHKASKPVLHSCRVLPTEPFRCRAGASQQPHSRLQLQVAQGCWCISICTRHSDSEQARVCRANTSKPQSLACVHQLEQTSKRPAADVHQAPEAAAHLQSTNGHLSCSLLKRLHPRCQANCRHCRPRPSAHSSGKSAHQAKCDGSG